MALQMGIIGLPNVGKSTLFNALTRSKGAEAANYPFCTIDPNVGIVAVPDARLEALSALVHPEKVVPAAVEFVDIAGLVKGASKGEGLGNKFLSHIREVDALCHVVRLFPSSDIIHVDGVIDPKKDREIVETELILADMESLHRQRENLRGAARTGDKSAILAIAVADTLMSAFENNILACHAPLSPEAISVSKRFNLLTLKPIVYAANISEEQLASTTASQAKELLGLPSHSSLVTVSAKIEEDLLDLSESDAKAFLRELKVESSGLEQLIAAAYRALGYQTYFTAGTKEVRAWTIRVGSTAPEAAGVIHTDFEKGFIRAETISFADYIACKTEQKAKEMGKLRTEGKDYIVKDGDVMHFRFNV